MNSPIRVTVWGENFHEHSDRDRAGIYGGSYGGFLTFMALFKEPGEIAPVPNVTKKRQPGAPGSTEPASPRNRDMS